MNPQTRNGASTTDNVREAIFGGLAYFGYARLMCLLVCLGVAMGMVYYVYSRAVYQSRAMVRFGILNLPFTSIGQPWEVRAALDETLNSRYLVERTALRLKLTNELGNYETLRDFYVPKIEVKVIDTATLAVDVFAYQPDLIKTWQPALVEEYKVYNEKIIKDRRERYLQVYKDELDTLKNRISEQNQARYTFEEDNAITELFVQQSGLTQVPKDMILTRHQIEAMDRVKQKLADQHLEAVEKLSLLSTLDREMKLEIGTMLPGTADKPNSQGTLENLAPGPSGRRGPGDTNGDTTVVVLPSMVNGLEPWQELDKEQRRLTQELHEVEKTYLPGHRKAVALNQELGKVKDALKLELDVMISRFNLEYVRLTEKLKSLEKQLPDYREVNKKYQSFRQQYALNEKGQLAWDQAYADLAKQIAATEFRGDKQPVDLEFLGYTLMREDPVSPPKMKLLMISLALGLAMALAVPFAMEKLNNSVARLEDAESGLNTPALGVIPAYGVGELEEMVRPSDKDAEQPDRLFENFRLIRASIALNRLRTGPSQAIMVSSARPREGKTTVALNLAWAFASMGERTLLLDCDLRRGRMHHAAKVSNERGLSNILRDKADWRSVVQKTTIPQLDILTRGPIRNGSTEMLCRTEFSELMATWRTEYARVILDTPPLLGLSEPSSLQRVVDGLVLVILAESTPLKDAQQALDLVRKSGGAMFGFVLNRLDLNKAKNYYNYYYYSPYYYAALEREDAVLEREASRS